MFPYVCVCAAITYSRPMKKTVILVNGDVLYGLRTESDEFLVLIRSTHRTICVG